MKMMKVAALVAVFAWMLGAAMPNMAWAEDGAALYKTHCAMCHNADASGKPAVKAPSIKGKAEADVKKVLAEGKKHAAAAKKLTAEQVKAIGDHLAKLK